MRAGQAAGSAAELNNFHCYPVLVDDLLPGDVHAGTDEHQAGSGPVDTVNVNQPYQTTRAPGDGEAAAAGNGTLCSLVHHHLVSCLSDDQPDLPAGGEAAALREALAAGETELN